MRVSEILKGLDWSDWPEIVATGLIVLAIVFASAGDYRSAALVSGPGALCALLAVWRARPRSK